jgi:DNA-binding response OmpR family regulator
MAQVPKSILWVDDEGDLLEPHRIFLRSKGYEVEWASNADDAVEMLRRHPYDLLLLDEQMPGKRGLEAYRDVREMAPNLPVVMVTKSEEDATLNEALGANIRDYMVKPISPRQVLSVVTKILEGPKIRQQAIARRFVERFRAIELERDRDRGSAKESQPTAHGPRPEAYGCPPSSTVFSISPQRLPHGLNLFAASPLRHVRSASSCSPLNQYARPSS